ncbi:hypothetical protein IYZ83_003895 [Wolbachia pipientis]|uniref:hypothetical protein n=1 Tax=Wolbachia pipientis TaxID=955 RepID=UPI001F242B5A|nr:hypothetical protein [Wolbachia pipientis]UIP91295.1 hypothetical protein IYZ83_003895 [Wolbachia pipientis]
MGLNYHNLKKYRRNFLDITGLRLYRGSFFDVSLGYGSLTPFCLIFVCTILLYTILSSSFLLFFIRSLERSRCNT